jgi:uncharacterized RDD family membrane protein YckC
MSDYDPGTPGEPWGTPPPPGSQPGGAWGPPPAPPPGGQPYRGQQLPPYSQFGSQQSNWASPGVPDGVLASWGERAIGYIVDALIGGLPFLLVYLVYIATKSALFFGLLLLASIWGLAIGIWFAVQIGRSGSSPGMRLVGLRCVRADNGQLLGGGTSLLRALIHWVCSFICVVAYLADMLWPLWDPRRQTLADKGVRSVVLKVPPEGFSLAPKSGW